MMFGNCLAYIDPGSGSIILQFVVGILLGAGLMFRRSLACVFRVFRRGEKLASSEPPSSSG